MEKYEDRFMKVLDEDINEKLPPEEFSPEGDEAAFDDSFENPETAGEFGTDPNMAGFQAKYKEDALGWISKINEFSEWLNGTDDNSLNNILIRLDTEASPFDGISGEAKRITGVARDLASISEGIKGAIQRMTARQPQAPQQPQY